MNKWTRDQKIAVTALVVCIASLIAALLVVPEFRRAMKLDSTENSQRPAETAKPGSEQIATRNTPPVDPRPNPSTTPSVSPSGNTQQRPERTPEPSCSEEGRYKSEPSDEQVNVTIKNESLKSIKVFWIDYDGQRVHYADVRPHESSVMRTYAKHCWVIVDENGTCQEAFVARPDLAQVLYK